MIVRLSINPNQYPELDRFEEFLLQRIERRQPEVEDPTDDPDLLPAEEEAELVKDHVLRTINRH